MDNERKRSLSVGLLAHVDAGKTTLSEAMLYEAGALRKLGRVDHGDTFLDNFALEQERGITIFSKQAALALPNTAITLLDTPGHIDFSAEMERTLQVLDYAILVISGTDGIQAHTQTLWRLLSQHKIPAFIFINKMDLPNADRTAVLAELKSRICENCIDFSADIAREVLDEELAMCDEAMLERYLDGYTPEQFEIKQFIKKRKVFPCYFGSALRLESVDRLLEDLDRYTLEQEDSGAFGAKVFKIARDEQGNRLSYLKITGGSLHVRELISGPEGGGWQEKINQIRLYSGAKYHTVDTVQCGMVCAVTGLTHTKPGMGLGAAAQSAEPTLEPVLNYRMQLPQGCDSHTMLQNMRLLEEEDPLLRVTWNEVSSEIYLQLMGEVQLEILSRLIVERFGVCVTFDAGQIVYKETITQPVVGIGHFEPLRHYAEVHLLLEPQKRGSGLAFATTCPTDLLDLNWQRLVLTHLAEKQHKGVLTGAVVTDLKITLIAGKAHVKHTEGGDFREATYRAVRQGLMQAESLLLEPYYAFRLELPEQCVGRAMNDIQQMNGTFEAPEHHENYTVITGKAPVFCMRNYWTEIAAYTRGEGRLTCDLAGYEPCHNADEIIANAGYDAVHDMQNTPDSVFCAHGAGYIVKWDEVPSQAHIDTGFRLQNDEADELPQAAKQSSSARAGWDDDAELRALFERTYGPVRDRGFEAFQQSRKNSQTLEQLYVTRIRADDYLLVDGYNIIFSWDELHDIASGDINAARETLINVLSDYKSVRKCHLIVVFDAYKVKGGTGTVEKRHGIDIVYTKEAETADMYIEQASYDLSHKHRVRVATSDGMEQMIILGHGAERMSATELKWEVEQANDHIQTVLQGLQNR